MSVLVGKKGHSNKLMRDDRGSNGPNGPKGFILPETAQTRPNFREGVTMDLIDVTDDVNAEYSLSLPDTKGSTTKLPCEKTEDEVSRMWQYNKLMGRGSLPKGVE